MQLFETTRALGEATGLQVDENDSRGENFEVERDWGIYRGSGYGLQGTDASGWLVTFAGNSQSSSGDIRGPGYLVAHAIERARPTEDSWIASVGGTEDSGVGQPEQPSFGGKCLLLAGPWDSDLEEQMRGRALQQEWFHSRSGGADVDVEMLDRWLQSIGQGLP